MTSHGYNTVGDFNSRSHSVAIKPKIDLGHMYKLTENAQALECETYILLHFLASQ